jgi:hypothetical protein
MTAVASDLKFCSSDVDPRLPASSLSFGVRRVDCIIVVKHCLCLVYLDRSV